MFERKKSRCKVKALANMVVSSKISCQSKECEKRIHEHSGTFVHNECYCFFFFFFFFLLLSSPHVIKHKNI